MTAIPLTDQIQPAKVGYLMKNGHTPSPLAEEYIKLLKKQIELIQLPLNTVT